MIIENLPDGDVLLIYDRFSGERWVPGATKMEDSAHQNGRITLRFGWFCEWVRFEPTKVWRREHPGRDTLDWLWGSLDGFMEGELDRDQQLQAIVDEISIYARETGLSVEVAVVLASEVAAHRMGEACKVLGVAEEGPP